MYETHFCVRQKDGGAAKDGKMRGACLFGNNLQTIDASCEKMFAHAQVDQLDQTAEEP